MVLNYIWILLFLIAFLVALVKFIFMGDLNAFKTLIDSVFTSSTNAFEISLGLGGMMVFWLGLLAVGEKSGFVTKITAWFHPLFTRLFPEVPADHPAMGHILMNFTANMLGLGNAATPIGLKAMESLQTLNPKKETATNAQIMFLVINTAGFTLLPVTILIYRNQFHSTSPADVVLPIVLSTFIATVCGILFTSIRQGIRLRDTVLIKWGLGFMLGLSILFYGFSKLNPEQLTTIASVFSNGLLLLLIALFLIGAMLKKVNVFETFIDGAKEGFSTIIRIIPYMVGMLVAVAVFRQCGALDWLTHCLTYLLPNKEICDAIPTALMKPFSASGARGIMLENIKTNGVDSLSGKLSSVFQGSTDTTFYIVALYFGAVGVKNTRNAISLGLLTDLVGFIAAGFIVYYLFV